MESNNNGFFGMIQGPFLAETNIYEKIQQQCKESINYISKIGFSYPENFDLNLEQSDLIIKIQEIGSSNEIDFQLGKTRMLQLENVKIKSIKFNQNVNEKMFIDYQYKK